MAVIDGGVAGAKSSPAESERPGASSSDEEDVSRYRKLLNLGVPPDILRHKMRREGICDEIVNSLIGKESIKGEEGVGKDDRTDDDRAVASKSLPPAKSNAVSNKEQDFVTDFGDWGVSVDPREPTRAWETFLKDNLPPIERVDATSGESEVHLGDRPRPEGYSRWVCISDTHGLHERMAQRIPDGDVLIHAGDFTRMGGLRETKKFCAWMFGLPHRHKILIAGNHEITMHQSFYEEKYKKLRNDKTDDESVRRLVRSCEAFTYLEDSSVDVLGYKVYGSPWQPEFCDWAFNLPRGPECAQRWGAIPADTDVLVTHGPPLGHGDLCENGLRAGCVDLLADVLRRVIPSHHVFGHIHEGYGCTRMGGILFLNASTCTFNYRPLHPSLVFDLPPRNGSTRASRE